MVFTSYSNQMVVREACHLRPTGARELSIGAYPMLR
jgi:hypothetical protein